MGNEKDSFTSYLERRIQQDEIVFFTHPLIQKAYYTGAYAKAVIIYSKHSEVSKKNKTFKIWLSNQIINQRNLDKILDKAFIFERKLRLKIWNHSEIRDLAHGSPTVKAQGISSAKISFAFVAGFGDYGKFVAKHNIELIEDDKESN